eukprot:7220844-Pyramimonas_sp.AAC.2
MTISRRGRRGRRGCIRIGNSGQDTLPARKPSRSLLPAFKHISSTRAAACSAVAFGWTADGHQSGPHVRDAGARCA